MKNNKIMISAVAPLRSRSIWDVKTGEQVSINTLEKDINALCSFVQTETERVFNDQTEQVIEDATGLTDSANSYGRQRGYKSDYLELPREVLAKSRINELFLFKLMSETASYAKNPNLKKEYPSFPKTINLGAVDKQMASLSRDGEVLTLLWKCWSGEYLIDFIIPAYILKRDIAKFSLPVIRFTQDGYDFIFSVQENVPVLPASKQRAGVDLGRVEPYSLAVVNAKGARIAHYTTSGRLAQLNRKRENILSHKRHVLTKMEHQEKLKMDVESLKTEKTRLATKATILGKVVAQQVGAEIARKLANHSLNSLNMEDLSWVQGAKYGSRWNHSKQQDAISHAVRRNGVRVKKVNPLYSSQLCHVCGNSLSHSKRSVRCSDCQFSLDRDFNAAMNIASLRHLTLRYPNLDNNRLVGDNCSSLEQVIDQPGHSSNNKIVQEF